MDPPDASNAGEAVDGDPEGTFAFDEVPIRGLRLSRLPPSSPSSTSSDDGLLEMPSPLDLQAEMLSEEADESDAPGEAGPRCCWHFERHFDYMVDRNLRPVEDFVLGRSPIMRSTDPRGQGGGHGYAPAPVCGTYSGSNGAALQAALAVLVRDYKLTWRELFGGYECYEGDRVNLVQVAVDREYQKMQDSVAEKTARFVEAVRDELSKMAATVGPETGAPKWSESFGEAFRAKESERLFSSSSPSPETAREPPKGATMGDGARRNVAERAGDPGTGQGSRDTVSHCPGYVRNESEMIAVLEERGFDAFYDFLDQLFVGLEGCQVGARYAYAVDLVTAVIRLMPEMICLLIGPRVGGRDGRGLRPCYFKRLVILVRSFLKFIGMEPEIAVPDMYRDAATGGYTPFYLLTGEKDLMERHAKSAMAATLLRRLFVLTKFISERCMCWVSLTLDNAEISKRLVQRLKRFVYLPLFSMKQVHELAVPLSGEFTCPQTCLFRFEYKQWIQAYLYPPPPLYLLRAELVDLVRRCFVTTQLSASGWYGQINDELSGSVAASGRDDHEGVLRQQLFMLVVGSTFFLAPEFLSTCVNYPEYLFGSFFYLLPHCQLGLQPVALNIFAEQQVYPLQEQVLDMLKVAADGEMLRRDDVLGFHDMSPVRSTVLRRILGLAWHYATAPAISDEEAASERGPRGQPLLAPEDGRGPCARHCSVVATYSVPSILAFLSHATVAPVRFRMRRMTLQPVKCLQTTADDIEARVRRGEEFVNHSRTAEDDYVIIHGAVTKNNPVEMYFVGDDASGGNTGDPKGMDQDPDAGTEQNAHACTLGCLVLLHAPIEATSGVDSLRWAVLMQCVAALMHRINEQAGTHRAPLSTLEELFGPLTPIWRALVELLCKTKLKGCCTSQAPSPDFVDREVFLGRKLK
ncbi:ridA family protein [Babesia caballi]|uniref:RidA family protein n=1 Tax=Babesia caballi TaxID=5871 RepID=A0AAV4LR25_BABCB|nr:ridA family protein [Babesia caballi]